MCRSPKAPFGIEGLDRLGHGVAVEHGDPEPHLIGCDDHLPVKSLVDDQILRFSNGKTRCANMFSACSGDNEVALATEDLFDELTALIDLVPVTICPAQRPLVFH